ncbi:MAG: chemotaxis protein CheD [SAR324 cluster bacterium]|nr:chemotaxis protein CheD [SAR324 cluster bacterium]
MFATDLKNMNEVVIGLGDMAVVSGPGKSIKTFALGSCVAVILTAPQQQIAGMVHIVLPDSRIDAAKAKIKPGYYADTAIPLLIQKMRQAGARDAMVCKIAGGGKMVQSVETFNIGEKNYLAAEELLRNSGLSLAARDVGGVLSRTVSVSSTSGQILLSCPGYQEWHL